MTPAQIRGSVPMGQDRTGEAVVFGRPVNFLELAQNLELASHQEKVAREKQRLAAEAERKKAIGGLTYTPAWNRSTDEFRQRRDKMFEEFNQYGGVNADLSDPSSPAAKMLEDSKIQLTMLSELDKDHRTRYFKAIEDYQKEPDKYEANFWQNLEEFDKLKSIEEREAYLQKNNFLEPVWSATDMLKRILVEPNKRTTESGQVTISTEQINPNDVKRFTEGYLLSPEGRQDYMRGLQKGMWKNPDEMVKWVQDQKMASGGSEYSRTLDEKPSDGTGWSSGGTQWNNGFVVVEGSTSRSASQNKPTASGGSEEYRLGKLERVKLMGKTGKHLPPMYVEGSNGNQFYTLVTGVEKENGYWRVKGRKLKEISAKEAEGGFDFQDIGADGNITYFKGLENVTVDYDRNSATLKAATQGFDLYDYEQQFNKNHASKIAGRNEQKYFETVVLNWSNQSDEAVDARIAALRSSGAQNVRLQKEKGSGEGTKAVLYTFKDSAGNLYSYNTNDPADRLQLEEFMMRARK